jgi:class 3 adenylate cyclase
MEPQIRYCTTTDGVSIAYCQGGEGTAFISVAAPVSSNIEVEWRDWEWYRILTARRRLIRFDNRGAGSSQRDVPGFSIEEMALDIAAVADVLTLDRFVLHAELWGVPIAIAYAAKHPERVSHLILFAGFARAAELYEIPRVKTLFSMLDQDDWELFTDTMCLAQVGWQLPKVAQGLAALMRASTTLERAQAVYAADRQYDVTSLLPLVSVPTLVMHPRGAAFPTLDLARKLAAGIPGARLKVLESNTLWSDELEPQFLDSLDEFLGDGGRPGAEDVQPQARRAEAPPASGTAVILFTDIVSSTALTERMGDARFRDASRALDAGLRAAIRDAGGAAIDRSLGDGVLATFPSAAQAIDGARRCLALSAASELGLHIGLHAGDVIREDNNVYGGAVNIASRICGLSAPGEILVSDVVRGMARSSAGVEFEDRGEQEMKGVGEPVRVYAVRWRE